MPLAPQPPARPPENPALDLPELDQGEDSGEVDVGVFELDMGGALDDEDQDDALDAFQVDIQEQIDPGSNEAAVDLDIGVGGLIDVLPEAPAPRDGDDLPPASTEIDFQLDAPADADDAGGETELGHDGLEALPELLADDADGDGPDPERALLPGAPEGAIPRGPDYEAEWLLLGSACTALWTSGADVFGAAERLMRFGIERESYPLPAGARVSALTQLAGGAIVLCTTRGLLELTPGGACTTLEAPDGLRGTSTSIAELGSSGVDDVWARMTNGVLMRCRGGAWGRHESGGVVRALTTSLGRVTLLVSGARPTLQLSSDGGSSFRELLLAEPAETVALGVAPMALADERALAIYDPERGLCVSGDVGETFHMVTGGVNVTAVALGQHAGAPAVFAALHREGRDVSEIILVQPATGQASKIAELSGEAEDETEETGRTHALIYANGQLWAAGGYGLAKLRKT